ncbi:hypothetical protein AFEL58S_02075 [Afipia felis]
MGYTIRRYSRLPGLTSILKPQPTIPGFIESTISKPRASLSDAAAIKQMASDMRDASMREGGITRDDLELLGFTPGQIDRCVTDARMLAQAQSHSAA